FRPGHRDQIATAGGNNHEVRLWRLNGGRRRAAPPLAAPLDGIRSPGSGLWGVAWSRTGNYFGWREKRADNPAHPNEWGAGAWRVFDLKKRKIRRSPPADFSPVAPINSLGGWRVETATGNAYVWKVTGPG